jgi:hypothetical protein
MIGKVFDLLFGCRHRVTSRPITPVNRQDQPFYTYIACLDCGKQFYYDTTNMRVGTPVPPALTAPYRSAGAVHSQA